jgi:FkbM family methyltransferase
LRRTIFDVGAHRGEDTAFYLRKGFRVVAVEADPALVSDLESRFADQISSGELTIVAAAIAPAQGQMTFYRNSRLSVWGTTRKDWADRNAKFGAPSVALQVPCVSFREIVANHGVPYYLKVDIEGVDSLCLEGLSSFEQRPSFISIESEKTSWEALLSEFSLLEALGYDRFKVVDQARVERQVPPAPPREGSYVEWRFPFGASGLFGEEAPGPWLTRDEAIQRYRGIFWSYRLIGDRSTWRSLTYRIPLVNRVRSHWYDTHAKRG